MGNGWSTPRQRTATRQHAGGTPSAINAYETHARRWHQHIKFHSRHGRPRCTFTKEPRDQSLQTLDCTKCHDFKRIALTLLSRYLDWSRQLQGRSLLRLLPGGSSSHPPLILIRLIQKKTPLHRICLRHHQKAQVLIDMVCQALTLTIWKLKSAIFFSIQYSYSFANRGSLVSRLMLQKEIRIKEKNGMCGSLRGSTIWSS